MAHRKKSRIGRRKQKRRNSSTREPESGWSPEVYTKARAGTLVRVTKDWCTNSGYKEIFNIPRLSVAERLLLAPKLMRIGTQPTDYNFVLLKEGSFFIVIRKLFLKDPKDRKLAQRISSRFFEAFSPEHGLILVPVLGDALVLAIDPQ